MYRLYERLSGISTRITLFIVVSSEVTSGWDGTHHAFGYSRKIASFYSQHGGCGDLVAVVVTSHQPLQ